VSAPLFTPAPWSITVDEDDEIELTNAELVRICELARFGNWRTRIATARLIAAAPELCRLLDLAVRQYDAVKGGPILGALEAARAVLAKARGDQ
jgi:hypothetical protein